jgi:exosome complex RNA-binding protein Csl4
MPQSTDLNKSPYYDDFNDDKNYYKVLFKPGITVQTRELTNLQSILQNQIEKFGSKFFTEGSIVIPGGFAYDNTFNAVEVETNYKGINVEIYYQGLVGNTITGNVSGVVAKVVKVLSKEETGASTTLFVKYQSSSPNDFTLETFLNGEELITDADIPLGNSFILSGNEFAKVTSPLDRSATSVGSAAKIEEGVYYIRGYFANVLSDTIVLSPYSNTPSCRVGLLITEEIIDSNSDDSLLDNAQGFSNFAAPGADRLKITATLFSKAIDDFYDDDFIELFRVENGIIRKIKSQTESTFINDILARRTFDESGNYYVNPFRIDAKESLNDRLGNNGLYYSNQLTFGGNVPNDDLGILRISPGKAYVKGYEISPTETVVDFPKPRTTKHVESSASNFYAGNLLKVNNVTDVPNIGITTSAVVTLNNLRLQNGVSIGGTIGFARVYDFELNTNAYSDDASQFNLYLFDIQTYTEIVGTASTNTIINGSYIQGKNSGAAGFVKSFSGANLSLYQVSGQFAFNEKLIIDGIESTISIGTVTDYSVNDIKSVTTETGFAADSILSKAAVLNGPFNIEVSSPTLATITKSSGSSFADPFKVGDIVRYERSGITSSVYARVTSINNTKTSISLTNVSTVFNVCTGDLGSGTLSIQNIAKVSPEVTQFDDSSLYTTLANTNIANVDLNNSNIYVRRQYFGLVKSANSITLPDLSGTDYVYAGFDEERYIVVNANGSIETLTSSNLSLNANNKTGTISGLSGTAGPCVLIVTQIKSNVSPKYKKRNRVQTTVINQTKYSTPRNSGLGYTSVYGTRVEDKEISLNVPDIIEVHGVFESSGTTTPTPPWITISGLNSPNSNTNDLILGELIIGETSGAVAVYAQQKAGSQLYVIYKSEQRFKEFETIKFQETGYTATVSNVEPGDVNIINNYILDNGQRKHFYDFGRIKRKDFAQEPSGRLTIYFDYFNYETTDSGDLITVNSYPGNVLKKNLPSFNGIKNIDTIDLRPTVGSYDSGPKLSPFDFSSRSFNNSYTNASQILVSNESFIFDYDFYLARIDKLTLSKEGVFQLVVGEPSEVPIEPLISTEVLDVATIISSPYVYDIEKDVVIVLADHKRYTMSDLRGIEQRVSNLEYYSTLSLLEVSTQNLLIEDENGLNRFKSGFFVDNFSTSNSSDIENVLYRAEIKDNTLSALSTQDRIDLSLYNFDNQISIEETKLSDTNSNNLKLTGKDLSLNYNEVVQIDQPFASRTINVNPFNIVTWTGLLTLSPSVDTWTVNLGITRSVSVASASRAGTSEIITTSEPIPYIRSRNIQFAGTRLKPKTRFNLSFNSLDLSTSNAGKTYAFPKLLEINSVVGVFKVGETIIGSSPSGDNIRFRLCVPNHKSGDHTNPSAIYKINPYSPSVGISTLYGPQSTFLNVDTGSLQISNVSSFYGNAIIGMNLYGLESGASAKIADNRLISDDNGTLIGSIFIPNPNTSSLKYPTGSTAVRLSTTQPALGVPGENVSFAEATFTSSGSRVSSTKITYYDPLAQTFVVDDENGIIPSSVDIFFATKSDSIPVTLQIRDVSYGTPGGPDKIIGGLEKVLLPSEVSTSSNGTVATTFTFDSLTRLEGGREYALVLLSDSDDYTVWIARMGEVEILTRNSPEVEKVIINSQPSMGSLFKSQNGTTWTPSQEEDLKFKLKKCKFSTSPGTARFYNSKVEVDSPENQLPENPIFSISNSAASLNDGRHMLVFHPSHGMNDVDNKVEIRGVQSDLVPTKLIVSYGSTESGPISVASTANYGTFDGQIVSPSNPGYIQIDNEIIKYESVAAGQLLTITRGSLNTVTSPHDVNSFVYKYEFAGVSLDKINTTHDIIDFPKPLIDSYYIQVAAGSSFTDSKFGGGSNVYASRNKQFSTLQLNEFFLQNFNKTSVAGKVRTVSSTSVDGSEQSFVDQGFSDIDVNSENFFTTPKMVCSRINEVQYLANSQFTGSKSFTLELNLSTSDVNLSPIIDLEQTFATTKNYRINQPVGISSYATNGSVNSNIDDPHAFIHVSKRIDLNQSANALKVLFSAYKNSASDIRVLYKIYRNDSPDQDQVWQLFPGYLNIDVNGNIIDGDNNDGRPDSNVPSSSLNEYRDYTFTINNLPEFTGYQIKIVASSNNQSYSPLLRDLRAIAIK